MAADRRAACAHVADRRIAPGLHRFIQLAMPRAYRVIAYRVPHVMGRAHGLGPGLREVGSRSGGLRPGNANRSGFRNAAQLVFDALGDIGIALAIR